MMNSLKAYDKIGNQDLVNGLLEKRWDQLSNKQKETVNKWVKSLGG